MTVRLCGFAERKITSTFPLTVVREPPSNVPRTYRSLPDTCMMPGVTTSPTLVARIAIGYPVDLTA